MEATKKKVTGSMSHNLTSVMVTDRINVTAEYYPYYYAHPDEFKEFNFRVIKSDKVDLSRLSDPDYYYGDPAFTVRVKTFIRFFIGKLIDHINDAGYKLEGAWLIIHDCDRYTEDDEADNPDHKAGCLKTIHYHLVLKWGYRKGPLPMTLAKLLGLYDESKPDRLPQAIQLPNSKYSFDNFLAYLPHSKDASKYQYPPKRIHTYIGDSYADIYRKRKADWFKGRKAKEKKDNAIARAELGQQIRDGKWSREDFILKYYNLLGDFNTQNKAYFEQQFDIANELRGIRAKADFDAGQAQKTVVYISGMSGTGKTHLTNTIFNRFSADYTEFTGLYCPYHQGGKEHPYDDYSGELVSLLDDFRGYGSDAEVTYKALDPHKAGVVDARYHNKIYGPRLVMVTSTKSALESAYFLKGAGGIGHDSKRDVIEQFLRRLTFVVKAVGQNQYKIDYIKPYPKGIDVDFKNDPIIRRSFPDESDRVWRLHYWTSETPIRTNLLLSDWFDNDVQTGLSWWNSDHFSDNSLASFISDYTLCLMGYAEKLINKYQADPDEFSTLRLAYWMAYLNATDTIRRDKIKLNDLLALIGKPPMNIDFREFREALDNNLGTKKAFG